jgi:hypothetical protein
MTDDELPDLSDDAVSILANLQDLLDRLGPHKKAATGTVAVWLAEADKLLIAAGIGVEEASGFLDMVVEEYRRREVDTRPAPRERRRLPHLETEAYDEVVRSVRNEIRVEEGS